MFGIGLGELILIIIVALLFISPEKLPEIAGSVVKAYREIRRAGNEFKRSVTEIEVVPSPKKDAGEAGGSASRVTGGEGTAKEEGKGAQGGAGGGGGEGVGSGQGKPGSSAS